MNKVAHTQSIGTDTNTYVGSGIQGTCQTDDKNNNESLKLYESQGVDSQEAKTIFKNPKMIQ